MDFRGIVEDTATETQELVQYILELDISTDAKEALLVQVFTSIGENFAAKTFADVSYILDSTAITGTVVINENDQLADLAKKIVRDNAFQINDQRITTEYFDVLLGRAEALAFQNAQSLDKHPTLERRATGRETCQWCLDRVGIFPYPDNELFRRHDDCDCKFIVSGYNSRNGLLKNYRKRTS